MRLKIILNVLFVIIPFFSLQAKYNAPPEGTVSSRAAVNAKYMFDYMDKNKDGKISLEEFKSEKMTRDVRRKVREAKKEGTYKSPEQQFEEMGPDEEGNVSEADFINYIRVQKGDRNAVFEKKEKNDSSETVIEEEEEEFSYEYYKNQDDEEDDYDKDDEDDGEEDDDNFIEYDQFNRKL